MNSCLLLDGTLLLLSYANMFFTQDQRVALLEFYFENKSYASCVAKFQLKFLNAPVPGKQTLYDLVHRFRETGSVNSKPRSGRPSALTREFLDDVHTNFQQSSKKSLCRLS